MHVTRRHEQADWRLWGRVQEGEDQFAEYLCVIDVAAHCFRVTAAKPLE